MKAYYQLTKPGIIYGNALTALGGFLLAARGHVDTGLLCATLLGISLVIASACVLNNIIDRNIDCAMARTKTRAIVTGLIQPNQALAYAAILSGIGFLTLFIFVNTLTVLLGFGALFSYVVLYGLAKRRSVHGTLVGTVPGAASIVAGYAAVTNRLDITALLLFLMLVFWQMAHFYSIAIYRLKDYKSAKIPVLPAKAGIYTTKISILLYITAFIFAVAYFAIAGYGSYFFGVIMGLLGLIWLSKGIKGLAAKDENLWARQMFKFSLIVILGLSIMLSLDSVLQ
jgi:protoheme IX farnesyltransferase